MQQIISFSGNAFILYGLAFDSFIFFSVGKLLAKRNLVIFQGLSQM